MLFLRWLAVANFACIIKIPIMLIKTTFKDSIEVKKLEKMC